jgi:hypothetical protein
MKGLSFHGSFGLLENQYSLQEAAISIILVTTFETYRPTTIPITNYTREKKFKKQFNLAFTLPNEKNSKNIEKSIIACLTKFNKLSPKYKENGSQKKENRKKLFHDLENFNSFIYFAIVGLWNLDTVSHF